MNTGSNTGVNLNNFNNILKPLKGIASNKLDIYGFDVETEHIRSDFNRKSGDVTTAWKQKFIMGSVYGSSGPAVFWNKEEMKDYLLATRSTNRIMLATNLEFDFNILFGDELSKFHTINRHGLIGAIYKDKNGRKVSFIDTMNYIRCGLDTLGKIVNIPKLPHPKTFIKNPEGLDIISLKPNTDEEKQELETYNINDSRITYEFGELFRNFCNAENIKMKMTISSCGLDYWRRNHQAQALFREPEWMLLKHFQGAFRGGLTNVFKRGTYNGRLHYFDYRSSYPKRLYDGVDGKGNFPDPSSHKYIGKSNLEYVERYDGITRAKIKAPYSYIPPLAIRYDDKLISPYGNYEAWATNYELRLCMKYGYEVEPQESIIYQEHKVLFRDCIKHLYDLRKEYKLKKHPFEALVKTLMNGGLFGKWGTNFTKMEEMLHMDKISFNENNQAMYDGKLLENYIIHTDVDKSKAFLMRKYVGKPMRYSFPIISTYTTMLGRMALWSDISKHPNEIVYTDTDSAVMTRPVFEDCDELGGWQEEHKGLINGGTFIVPKMYSLNILGAPVVKSKGVGKYMRPDNFLECIENKKVDMQRFSKMVESNRIGIDSGTMIALTKHLSLEDTKRSWKNKFDVNAWEDSEPIKI